MAQQTSELQALIAQAETATKARDWAAADALWRLVLQRQGRKATSRTYVRLSQANRNLKRLEEAESILAAAMHQLSQKIDKGVACEAARVSMARGDYIEALARWQLVFDNFPSSVPAIAYIGKSRVYRHLGQFGAATHVIRAGLTRYRDDERLWREQDLVVLEAGLRFSNPYQDLRVPQNRENWNRWKTVSPAEAERRWRKARQELFAFSGEAARIQELRGAYFGKRCFVVGSACSLSKEDVLRIRGEYTFVTDRFVNAENCDDVAPAFYCVVSHELFGGWNKPRPSLDRDFYERMLARTAGAIKFFPFAFRDYIRAEGLFPGHDVRYLLFEQPKYFVDEMGSINLDLNRHLDDARTAVFTMCVPLAVHMGFSEIVLLGCDDACGIESGNDVERTDNEPVSKVCETVSRELQSRAIRLRKAATEGRFDVIPRMDRELSSSFERCRPRAGSAGRAAFCSVVSDVFVQGFAVLLYSIRKCHPEFDYPYVVLHSRHHAPLSAENQAYLKGLYQGLVFKEVDESAYEGIWNQSVVLGTPERLKPSFFFLDAFSLTGFDRIVALDGDMVCLGDISELLSVRTDLALTRAWDYESGRPADYFNAGLIVIGKPHLTGRTYERLLHHKIRPTFDRRIGKSDQAILNDLFSISSVDLLPERFNTTKRKFPDHAISSYQDVFAQDVRILHYVGEKPWQEHVASRERQYKKVEQLWVDMYAELRNADDGKLRRIEPYVHEA